MAVSVGNGRSPVWIADGINRVWAFPFKVLSAAHVTLEITTPDGVVSTISGGFTVSNLGANDGGTVTFPIAPNAPLEATVKV
jgi:hypothetical protein